jgi:hypothetical protein
MGEAIFLDGIDEGSLTAQHRQVNFPFLARVAELIARLAGNSAS